MNHDEGIAYSFLKENFEGTLKFEPDGNIPPDFSLDGKIGIEVRRLNKNFKTNSKKEGIENLHHNLTNRITNILQELDNKESPYSYLVSLRYRRPFSPSQKFNKRIKKAIMSANLESGSRVELIFDPNLQLQLQRSPKRLKKKFLLASISDKDRGGMVVNDIYTNLKLVMLEKCEKIDPYFIKFEEWWLVLIDHIYGNLDEQDTRQLLDLPKLNSTFEKIYIVSPKTLDGIEYT